MQGIVAQEKSKGHGDVSTVPIFSYGMGVASGSEGSGVTGTSGVPGAGAVWLAAEIAAASAAVSGMPASIHAW
jgi:hypothetical protein